MKILVIGSGAREHAIVWKLKQSKKVNQIFIAPGNAGTAQLGDNVDIADSDVEGLKTFAKNNDIDLTVVGPEVPLCLGIVDIFEAENLRVFGPNKKAAELEGSKVICKDFFRNHNIPTAKYESYSNVDKAVIGLEEFEYPLVIKADGLAAGKGVVICETKSEALLCLDQMMTNKKFGDAGSVIVIEEFLDGIEASLLCFVDGKTLVPMESAKDYKKSFDGDRGLNTGGMGTYSPNHIYDKDLQKKIKQRVLIPTMNGFAKDGIEFKGILFIGLMIKGDDIKVLEFNVRFGDPETEVILPRLETDLVDIFEACIDGTLTPDLVKWSTKQCACVIIASGGYPENYEKGKSISGLSDVPDNLVVFHAGTKLHDNNVVSNGGRVLAVTAVADTVEIARQSIYKHIDKIKFENSFYRSDIGIY